MTQYEKNIIALMNDPLTKNSVDKLHVLQQQCLIAYQFKESDELIDADTQFKKTMLDGLEFSRDFSAKQALNKDSSMDLKRKAIDVYKMSLLNRAKFVLDDFCLYMELDIPPEERFYEPRRMVLQKAMEHLQLGIDGDKKNLAMALPNGAGKSASLFFLMAFLAMKFPKSCNLYVTNTSALATHAYVNVLNLMTDTRYKYNELNLLLQQLKTNAEYKNINLKTSKVGFPTLQFRSIEGGIEGQTRYDKFCICDDLVAGLEESLSMNRLDGKWAMFTEQVEPRREGHDYIKIMAGTPWSTRCPVNRFIEREKDNLSFKYFFIPALDENDKSNFEYKYGKGTTTEQYHEMRRNMPESTFLTRCMMQPRERGELVFMPDSLKYFTDLPVSENENENIKILNPNSKNPSDKYIKVKKPDAAFATIDGKNQGKDYVAAPIAFIYDTGIYIVDAIFNRGLPAVTKPLLANMLIRNKVSMTDCEMNNGGDFFGSDVRKLVQQGGGSTTFRYFYTTQNKLTKIITQSDWIIPNFIFWHKDCYAPDSEYAKFMRNLFQFPMSGKCENDDAPDSLAELARMIRDIWDGKSKARVVPADNPLWR